MSVTEVLEKVRALSDEEWAQVRVLLGTVAANAQGTQMAEDEFEQHLAAQGVITLPASTTAEERARVQAAFDAYQPIEVGGVPLSQIVIEERR